MPYTAAQLTSYYTLINQGVAPDAATTLLLNAYATQNTSGALTDAQTLAKVVNSEQAAKTTDVAVSTYAFFTGTVPSQAGLAFLVNGASNTTDLNDTYYASFNQENRYYNFAINLAFSSTSATGFSTTYSALTLAQTIATAYETIIGTANVGSAAAAAAIADIQSRSAFFTQVAATRAVGLNQDLAVKAVAIAYILNEAVKADVGTYAKALDQFKADVAGGVAIYGPGVVLTTTYGPGGAGYNIGIGGTGTTVGGVVGATLGFTGGVDNLNGTVNDDTFNATLLVNGGVVQAGTSPLVTTFQAADTAVGGGGNDTLNLTILDPAGGATGSIAVPAAGVAGIRNIFVRGTSTTAGDVDTVVSGNFAGAVQFVSDRSTNAVTVTGLVAGQAIGVNGNGAATIGAVTATYGGTVTAEVINLTNGTGNNATPSVGPALTITTGAALMVTATINSSGAANVLGATQLNVAASVSTLNIAANSALTVGALTGLGSSVAPNTIETINVTGNSAVTLGTIGTAGGTGVGTLNVNVNTGSTLTTGVISTFWSAGTNNTINVNGTSTTTTANAASVTLGVIDASVKTINAGGLTAGGVSATIGANTATIFTGGSGTDVVTIGGGQGAALTGTIAGGSGNDIIAFSTGADLANSLTSLVSSFETLRVSNAGAVGTNQAYDPTLINGITTYQVAASAGGVTLNNMLAAAAVTVTGNAVGTGTASGAGVQLNLANAGGGSDVVNLTLNNGTTIGTNVNGVLVGINNAATGGVGLGGSNTAGQVETLTIASAGRVAGTGVYNSVTLVGSAGPNFTDANTVKVTGAAGLTIRTGASQHGQTIDASASTGGVQVDAATTALGAGGTLTLIGSGVNDTFITGNANTVSIYGGAGGDASVLGAGTQTLVYKAGTESQLDLTGAYTAVASATNNTQTNTGNSGASGTGGTVNASKMDVVTGFATGTDKIDLSTFSLTGALGGGLGGNGTAGGQTANDDAGFNALLNNANLFSDGVLTRGIAQIKGAATMSSGVAGDFIIVDVNKSGAYDSGDLVIKLAGTAAVVIGDFNL